MECETLADAIIADMEANGFIYVGLGWDRRNGAFGGLFVSEAAAEQERQAADRLNHRRRDPMHPEVRRR